MGCCNSGEADGDRQRDALARRGRQRAFAERAGQAEVALQRGGAVGDETEQVGQCFWLSPSITTRSPGSMIASSNRVARFAGQTFPLAPHTAAARASRGGRSGSCRDGSNIAKLLRFLLSSAAKGGSRSLITEMIFYNIIDREYGLMPCWILSCCAPSLPWLSAAAQRRSPRLCWRSRKVHRARRFECKQADITHLPDDGENLGPIKRGARLDVFLHPAGQGEPSSGACMRRGAYQPRAVLITAYRPLPSRWTQDFMQRKKS